MINIINPSDCCGCTACASICPKKAIKMVPDALGFLYPEVNITLCVDCGLCDKVCAFNDDYDKSLNFKQPEAYGARHKDVDEVMKSRSGAAFVVLSDYVLGQGGIVYGAGYADHFRVVHKRAVNKEQRDEFRGSKYVQSDLTGVFESVKNDLKNGLLVLFSGTPCQTSGLNSFLGPKLRDNLILVDIVCHSVPSPKVWQDYITILEKNNNANIETVNFRDKGFGWNSHKESYVFSNGNKLVTNDYTQLFSKVLMMRKSCNFCHFCNTTRPSDITIADFWGWEKTDPEINKDNRGVNLLLVNTEKGKSLLNFVSSDLNLVKAELESCLQTHLKRPTDINPNRDEFENLFCEKGIEYVMKKYRDGFFDSFMKRVKKLLKRLF